jgi:hypothetical protein
MKKLLLLLCTLSLISNGQSPYNKLLGTLTDWYVFNAFIPISQGQKPNATSAVNVFYGKYSANTDTLVMGKLYKKFFDVYTTPSFINNYHIGYIREDSAARKVYFLDKTASSEDLLYDFSLNVNDSAFLNFPQTVGTFPKGYYKVRSITNVTIKAGVRKQFVLKKNPAANDSLIIIESVGSIIHPAYMYESYYGPGQFSWVSSSCKYPYHLGLSCKFSDNVKQFQSCTYTLAQMNGCFFKYDSCNYWNTCSAIAEHNVVRDLRLVPNPATQETELDINVAEEVNMVIEIYDLSGRKVKHISSGNFLPGETSIKLNISDVEQGYYFIRLSGKDFELNTPLIITR